MLRHIWWEFLCGVKKGRLILTIFFMLYFSCVSVVQHEGIWRFQNVVQFWCILIIFGAAFNYYTEQAVPRVFFYVPRKRKNKGEGLLQYIRLRLVVEVLTFVVLSLGVDGVAFLFNRFVRHRSLYMDVPGLQLMNFGLFVLCLIYFRVGAFHRMLFQRWMFQGSRVELLHFGMAGVTALAFFFSESMIDSAIAGLIPSAKDYIILGAVVLLCLLDTFYFAHRCIEDMSKAEIR